MPADAPDSCAGHRADVGRPGRRHPGQPDAGRRHLAVGHRRLGEAQHRRDRAGLGRGSLHPVRPVQLRLSARRDPAPSTSTPARLDAAPDSFQVGADQCARLSRCALHAAVLRGGLHRLRPVRRGLPDRARRRPLVMQDKLPLLERRARQPRVLRDPAGERSRAGRFRQRARRAVPRAAVRLLRRLRGLRRDAVSEAAVAVVRRPDADRQRHRLLLDLRRQPAGDAVDARTAKAAARPGRNSLFEDNAEFGLGFRLAADQHLRLRAVAAAASSRPSSASRSRRRRS